MTPSRSGAVNRAALRGGQGQNEAKAHGPGRGLSRVRVTTFAGAALRLGLRPLLLLTGATLLPLAAAVESPEIPDRIEFNRDVRRILSNTCLKCHGPDAKGNPSGLRLDHSEFAYAPHKDKSGRVTTALVPGKPEASEVWRRITSTDPAAVMPPRDALHQLSATDKAVFKRWIEQGAVYQPHWAYRPPVKVEPPTTRAAPGSPAASSHPVDRFLQAELSRHHLTFSPPADRRTLLRRLSLDLTGLPPTPDEVTAFVADSRPGAYEAQVDRLLASPRYGERMAVPWLDLVRFADSTGLHGDQLLNNFPYRDYVIDAFNRNKPFDQFTLEQIAGDLLPQATIEQQVATGFNRLNMVTREGGAQVKEYLAKYASDRVRTVSTAWLGSTLACAECHDHKYDPFTIRDFYSFAAYFSDVKQWGVYRHFVYTPEPELAVHTDDYPFPPEIEVDSHYLQQRDARLRAAADAAHRSGGSALLSTNAGAATVKSWARQVQALLTQHPEGWAVATPERVDNTNGVSATPLPDGSVRLQNPKDFAENRYKLPSSRHEVVLSASALPISTVRLEVLPDETHGGFVTRDQRELFEISVTLAVRRAGQATDERIEPAEAFAECETETYFNGRPRVSLLEVWRSSRALARGNQAVVFQLRQPVTLKPGDRLVATVLTAPVNFHQRAYLGEVGRIRFSVSPLAAFLPGSTLADPDRAAFAAAEPSPAQRERLATHCYRATLAFDQPGERERLRDILECRGGRAATMVTVATAPLTTRVLARGNWQDETGEVVSPAPPRFLTDGTKPAGSARETRLDLARWLVSPANPLTARTFVNRTWKQLFGTGLSAAVEDLGMQGEYPTHPELLDWLAVEFRESGWDIKGLIRLIVTSQAYQQSSRERPELGEIDPRNRLLARQSARRLEAEFVRDNALAVSGLLTPDIGGPSASPYQPPGYYEQLNFPLRDYIADRDERQYRRGLYSHWQRTFLHPMLANFDAPSREECAASRNDSTTPQQALTLLNDPTFVEAARALAEVLLLLPADQRLEAAFLRVLSRPPEPRERTSLEAFHARQLATFRERPQDAVALTSVGLKPVPASTDRVELAAWTAVARALLNLNETIVRY
ncbi:MAG: PSD1 and planctomycete cytochrome C domain-containing protein [Opitutaceae bacterium]